MNLAAVKKAEACLDRAKEAFAELNAASTFKEVEPAWSNFLIFWNRMYTVLEQGAKDTPQSRQWFGDEKRERRKDPLLNYLHQARNADEHGIEPITHHERGYTGIGAPGSGPFRIKSLIYEDGVIKELEVDPMGGPPVEVTIKPSIVRLVTVHDRRFNTSFDPPQTHRGQPVIGDCPWAVAEAGLAYAESLMTEAKRLAA